MKKPLTPKQRIFGIKKEIENEYLRNFPLGQDLPEDLIKRKKEFNRWMWSKEKEIEALIKVPNGVFDIINKTTKDKVSL